MPVTLKRLLVWSFGAVLLAASFGTTGHAEDFTFNGTRIHYLDVGEGEPIVLIHGLTGSSEAEWRDLGVIDELAGNYRVIAIDVRGHGQSDKPHDPSSYGVEMSEDVVRLLDSLGIERADIVGYSMGSIIAAKFAAMHPDRVGKVVFGGLAPDPAFVAPPPGTPPPPLPEPTPEELAELQKRTDPQAIGAVLASMGSLALTPAELASLDAPLLAIVGSDDPLKSTVDAFARSKTGMEVVVIDGATHSGPASAQANPIFVEEILSFLADQ